MRIIFLSTGLTLLFTPALAENLLPNVKPDVILTCFENDKPASTCAFGCANILGVVGKTVSSGFSVQNASRIEMFTPAKQGRADEHVWVAYRHQPFVSPQPSQEETGYAFVASSFTCQWPGKVWGGPEQKRWAKEWRIDTFNQ